MEVFKRMGASGDFGASPAGPGEVPCDLCLVCLASYCNAHLERHHTVQALKWHQLINPVLNLEDRVCKKHNRVMEFFCRREQSCVCVVCLKNDHVMHKCVSLEVEVKERKTKLQRMKRRVSRMLNKKCTKVSVIKSSMIQDQQEVRRTKAETIKVFTAMESRKVKLMELLEEKQRAAEHSSHNCSSRSTRTTGQESSCRSSQRPRTTLGFCRTFHPSPPGQRPNTVSCI